ncbi:MAG TPA: flagellar hook-basal body complex protein FliE [Janthinobacterium sp.]|nr:flagellar hook-basal body complex protein FliE [Janthinobacterium sp.]
MANDMSALIHSDLAALRGAMRNPDGADLIPAANIGANIQPDFAQSMKDAIGKVDHDERLAVRRMNEVDSGKSDDLVGAMLSSQQANLSFSMLMQVRNKIMGAVDELIKLPL